LPTRPIAVGSWLSLPSNTWLPSSHSVTLDRQRLHPIGAKGQSRTNCWVDPILCLVIRSDKRRTLKGEPLGGRLSQQGYPVWLPKTGTLFGCGPKASQSTLAFRNTPGRGRGRTSGHGRTWDRTRDLPRVKREQRLRLASPGCAFGFTERFTVVRATG
jgi:hypothetical protein